MSIYEQVKTNLEEANKKLETAVNVAYAIGPTSVLAAVMKVREGIEEALSLISIFEMEE